jgi:hypothetical protein
MLEKVLRHLEKVHIEVGESTMQLSIYFGSKEIDEREVVRTAASIVRKVAKTMGLS